MSENKEISFDSNFLTVDGRKLRADVLPSRSKDKLTVSSTELQGILAASRSRILTEMESIYRATLRPGLTVSRPSIFTTHLGTDRQSEGPGNKVFTDLGKRNGGVITEADEINEGFHEHFAMIGDAGFMPEVRRTSGARPDRGTWLLLRKPTLWEVADNWFGYNPSINYSIEGDTAWSDFKKAKPEHLSPDMIAHYRRLGEEAVDAYSDKWGDKLRPRFQIGLILAVAALKQTMGDHDGYAEEIDDAFTYADNDASIHESAVRAIENSTYGTFEP